MKIGVVNFELAPAGLTQLLDVVIKDLLQADHQVTGIDFHPTKEKINYHQSISTKRIRRL